MIPFNQVCILGGGLLGGSLALALRQRQPETQVRLWSRNPATTAAALERGISGATSDLAAAVAGADLLVLAVPVGAMPALLVAAVAGGLPGDCLVTDVGSVKQAPHRELEPLLAGRRVGFIGSHPMAGSEKVGIAAADEGIFSGAACLLTHGAGESPESALRLEEFWRGLGCVTSWWSAAEHDALVARISHLPHLLAANAAAVCLAQPELGVHGGGGLRDTTRVAAGDPAMWAEILMENSAALAGPLRESIASLTEFLAFLESGQHTRVCEWLAVAKARRDELDASRHPSSTI